MKKSVVFVYCLLIASSMAFAQGSSESTTPKKSLVVAVQSLPQSSIAAMAEISNVANRIDFSIEETLVLTDYYDDNKQKPGLAESWEMIDDTTIIFNLRKGVKFHNGQEMTAEDVAFTFSEERFLGPDAPGRATAGAFLGNLQSVTALDRYTVEIKVKKPDAILITRFANLPSQIISKKAYLDAGSWDAFSRLPVGTGPYKVTEFTDSVRVVLERFDEYWGPAKAAVDRIEFRYVPELSTRIAGLRSGEFDIITEIPPDQAEAIQNMPGISVVGGPIQNIYG
ncbi:MAG: ABC transporter substrate-binding protein, partial [Sphaerochaetaceae bacterium]